MPGKSILDLLKGVGIDAEQWKRVQALIACPPSRAHLTPAKFMQRRQLDVDCQSDVSFDSNRASVALYRQPFQPSTSTATCVVVPKLPDDCLRSRWVAQIRNSCAKFSLPVVSGIDLNVQGAYLSRGAQVLIPEIVVYNNKNLKKHVLLG